MSKANINNLIAKAEAHQRAFYYLMNHVKRSDDIDLAKAAEELALNLQKKASHYRKKAEDLAVN